MRWQSKILPGVSLAVLFIALGGGSLFASVYPAQNAAASGGAGETGGGQWQFSREIAVPQRGPYYELYLDEAVYRAAAEDLRDLRVVDSQGNQVPYYLESGGGSAADHWSSYSSALTRRVTAGTDTLLDYRIIPTDEHVDIEGNMLVFGLPGESFLKHVEVWGGYDGKAWEPLAGGDLYATNGLSGDSLELDSSYKFTYYRLLVRNNPEGLDFPTLTLVNSSREWNTAGFLRQKTPDYVAAQVQNRTEVVINNEDRLRMVKLKLDSTGTFSRRYELHDNSGSLLPVAGNGKLYRLDFQDTRISQTDIRLTRTSSSPELRLSIYNQDDAPIAITGLKMEYEVDRLVFAGGGQESYSLLYGNALAAAPQYDIINFKDQIAGEGPVEAALGAESAVPAAVEGTPAAANWVQGRWGFNIVIIAVSLLLVLTVARKLGRS